MLAEQIVPDKCKHLFKDCFGNIHITNIDSAYELKIDNIEPVQSRVEDFVPNVKIDGVLSRAFASLKDMLHWCQHLVDSQGDFLALKGQLSSEELDCLPLGFILQETIKLDVPGVEGERHIVKIKKQSVG